MTGDLNYFGLTILGMGQWFNRAQWVGYFGRCALMSFGLMTLLFGLSMGFDLMKMFEVSHLFTAKVIESGEAAAFRVFWVLAGLFLLCFIAFFVMGFKKFKNTLNGDEVAMDLFEDINVSLKDKEGQDGAA